LLFNTRNYAIYKQQALPSVTMSKFASSEGISTPLQTLQTFHTSVTPFPGTAKGLGELSVMNVINSRINCNDFTYN